MHGDDDFFYPDSVHIERDGQMLGPFKAQGPSKGKFHMPSRMSDLLEGDVVHRQIGNGRTEVWEVVDAGYHPKTGPFEEHYQAEVEKIGKKKNYQPVPSITVSGSNSRVTIGNNNSDYSKNVAFTGDVKVFSDLREVVKNIDNDDERAVLEDSINEMELSINSSAGNFKDKYQSFINAAASHMALVAPFVPALTGFL